MTEFPWLFLIPLAPLVGAFYNGVLGHWMQKRYGKAAVHVPAIALPTLSFIVTVAAFVSMLGLPAEERALHQTLWDWVVIGALDARFALVMDPLSLVMCFVVTFVGTLIHVYSIGYMHEEPSYWRFFSYLNLFMFAMLTLVLGDNLVVMFIGWEGVGLCSYLLIAFWYQEKKNAAAGMKAFVVNRIGDFGFIVATLLLFWGLQGDWKENSFVADPPPETAHTAISPHATEPAPLVVPVTSVTFSDIEKKLSEPELQEQFLNKRLFGVRLVTLIAVLFFLGAMGKSAQIPLYVWLPDAMAGPTPVSALIHAATMVTAGVYMVARLNFIYALSPFAMTWVTVVGCLTAIFAATIGFFQHDIKKVLAYSTVSQLGFMFMAVGVGAYWVGIFHLMTHAFFKACLFLGSGSVILGCHHEQDMRKMGGLRRYMPRTALTYFVACTAIAGFPLTSGFFSKDEILWRVFSTGNLSLPGGGFYVWIVGAITAVFTAYYMFRSYYMTFSGDYRGGHAEAHASHGHGHPSTPHESPANMTGVLTVLAVCSLFGGLVGLPHLWHLPNLLHHWLEPVFEGSSSNIYQQHFSAGVEWGLMGLSVALAFLGWFVARSLYRDNKNPLPNRLLQSASASLRASYRLVFNKYYVDELYEMTVIRLVLLTRRVCDWFDRRVVDSAVNLTGFIGKQIGFASGATDSNVVDGAVNGVATAVSTGGNKIRLIRTGNIRTYLYLLMAGAIALVALNYWLIQ